MVTDSIVSIMLKQSVTKESEKKQYDFFQKGENDGAPGWLNRLSF